jgi:hypothetical protein
MTDDLDGATAWYSVRCVFRCGWPPEFADTRFFDTGKERERKA